MPKDIAQRVGKRIDDYFDGAKPDSGLTDVDVNEMDMTEDATVFGQTYTVNITARSKSWYLNVGMRKVKMEVLANTDSLGTWHLSQEVGEDVPYSREFREALLAAHQEYVTDDKILPSQFAHADEDDDGVTMVGGESLRNIRD